jgi:hypothetical protein
VKFMPLTRDALDGRSSAAKLFDHRLPKRHRI